MPKAFISYARDGGHGENLAIEIQQQLQAAGFAVFRDVTGLKPGDPWFHKLEFELETSDVLVLVVSEKVRTSKWVHNEVSMAEEIGIPVIPVLAEKVRYPLWLRHLQVLDFCGVRDWAVLLEVVGRPSPPNPLSRQAVEGEQENAISLSPSTSGRRVGVRESGVSGRYVIHNNGTVTDTETGLMWKRCSEGQSGADCSGEPAKYTWDDAMSKFGKGVGLFRKRVDFADYNDWRMPTLDELRSIVEKDQYPKINCAIFPTTGAGLYWSSSNSDKSGASGIWFDGGGDAWSFRSIGGYVRLVRSGQ